MAPGLRLERSVIPIRGQILLLKTAELVSTRVINVGNRYLVCRDDGHVLVGSCEEEVGYHLGTTDSMIESLRDFAISLIPALAKAEQAGCWSGLRPMTFDGFPMIGRVPGSLNLYVAGGHYRSGLHLSPGTATMLSRSRPWTDTGTFARTLSCRQTTDALRLAAFRHPRMNEPDPSDVDDRMTLDPPGRIIVVGAGPLGIEAALYGRFLGYDVSLVEAVEVGHSMRELADSDLRIFPDRCLSSLARAALDAQRDESVGQTLPLTVAQWIDDALIPLTETDLLRGRLLAPMRVTQIVTVPVEADEEEEVEELDSIPPDFRLTVIAEEDQPSYLDAEAVIIAVGSQLADRIGLSAAGTLFFPHRCSGVR